MGSECRLHRGSYHARGCFSLWWRTCWWTRGEWANLPFILHQLWITWNPSLKCDQGVIELHRLTVLHFYSPSPPLYTCSLSLSLSLSLSHFLSFFLSFLHSFTHSLIHSHVLLSLVFLNALVAFLSHSMSMEQLRHLYLHVLPDLRGLTVVDVGARLGAVLYAVCIVCVFRIWEEMWWILRHPLSIT